MKKLLVVLCTALLFFGAAGAASASLLENGDFQTGDFTGWQISGDVSIHSWVNSSGVNYFAFLGCSAAGGFHTLCQDLYLEPYTKYVDISFTYKFSDPLPPPDTFKSLLTFEKESGGTAVIEMVVTELTTGWMSFAGTYEIMDLDTDPDPNARICFSLLEPDSDPTVYNNSAWAVVDNVVVEAQHSAVPEPASMMLLGTGLIGLAGLGRKKLINKA